jgi:hypothetical protein
MEFLPEPEDIFTSESWTLPTSYERQSLLLLDVQSRHQKVLYDSGVASKVYATLSSFEREAFDNTVPALQKYMVFRRIYPNTPNAPNNMTFGVVFAICDFSKSYEPQHRYLRYAQVGDYVDGTLCPRPEIPELAKAYDDHDREVVFSLVQELINLTREGVIPDLKYNLTALMNNQSIAGPQPPFSY